MRRSEFRIQNSEFNRRSAVTILEVIFAILITTIGLLGAVALLPVASSQARRGRVHDALAAAGRASISRLDTMGLRQPERWIAFHVNLNDLHGVNYSNTYSNFGMARPVWTEFEIFRRLGPVSNPTTAGRNWLGGVDSLCIDPRLIAANANFTTTPTTLPPEATVFPTFTTNAPIYASTNRAPFMWRITLNNFPGSTQAMSKIMADAAFVVKDELVFNRDKKDRSKPAQLPFDDLATGVKDAARQNEGHFSWMATLVPERNAMPQWPASIMVPGNQLPINDLYTLSMVMFYDRPADLDATTADGDIADPLHERMVQVRTINGLPNNQPINLPYPPATGGGEFELVAQDPSPPIFIDGEPITGKHLLKIKPNDWICLAGQTVHQAFYIQGGTPQPIYVPIFKWYRVSDCEPEATDLGGGTWQRYVTLIGQDWPLPAEDVTPAPDPKNGLRTWAIIVDGVVGVYEKSVKLEIGADN